MRKMIPYKICLRGKKMISNEINLWDGKIIPYEICLLSGEIILNEVYLQDWKMIPYEICLQIEKKMICI